MSVTLGGSEIGAACGLGPESATTLAARKLGLLPELEPSEAMRLGKELEPFVVEYARELGHGFYPSPTGTLYADRPAWARATPDGFESESLLSRVVEVKVTNGFGWPHDGVPLHYQAQGQWYAWLTGAPGVRFYVLVGGTAFRVYDYERDEAAIARLIAGGEAFMRLVRRGKLPAPDGSPDAHATIRALWPRAEPGKAIRANRAAWALVRELRGRREQREAVKRQDAELQQRLEAYMQDAESLISPHDEEVATFKTVESRRLDTPALKAAVPHVYEEFSSPTITRRFTLK